MTGRRRAIIELTLAIAAAVGCVISWLQSESTALVAPIATGEPATTSTTYYAPLLVLALVLATLAGILTVLGAARLRHNRPAQTHAAPAPADSGADSGATTA